MEPVYFFGGKTAGGKAVSLNIEPKGIKVTYSYDTAAFEVMDEPFFVPFEGASFAHVANKLMVYLDKSATSYLSIPGEHPDYLTIRKAIDEANPTWFGKLMKLNIALLLAIFIGLLILGYFAVTNFVPWAGDKIISAEQEAKMGEQLFDVFVEEGKIDTERTRLMKDFTAHLQLSKKYPLKVTVIESNEVNAFALPGGNIVVYTGIIDKMKSENELAALLAHEATHINKRHSLKSLLRSSSAGLMISLVFNDVSGIATVLVDNAENLRSLGYSRGLEREADEEGMRLLVQNKVDPISMRDLMLRLKEAYGNTPDALNFLSTHPATDERISNAKAFANKYSRDDFQQDSVLHRIWNKL